MFLSLVKNHLTKLPYSLGKVISLIPYSHRPGIKDIYRSRIHEITYFDHLNYPDKQSFIFERVKKIAVHAYQNVPFYTKLYREKGINPNDLISFKDLESLPIISKKQLQSVPLEERSFQSKGRSIVNTGGSSGEPLSFYIEPSSIAHEWAHMHRIWSHLGFRPSDLKVTFSGRVDVRNTVEYDSARHQLTVDIYKSWQQIADTLLKNFDKYKPSYLHGYPSAVFDFIIWLDTHEHPLLSLLQAKIKGILLGSEAPSIPLRNQIEDILGCKSVSWYGHTERVILAYEKEAKRLLHPFQTYGYTEAIKSENNFKLLGTSYYNYTSPLIRYDTGDLVCPQVKEGILESFEVTEGREGEFILDAKGNKIFLTALIFGRHHSLFGICTHLQIGQKMPGKAEVYVTPIPGKHLTAQDAAAMFDGNNVLIDFSFSIIDTPLRSRSGKVPLLWKDDILQA